MSPKFFHRNNQGIAAMKDLLALVLKECRLPCDEKEFSAGTTENGFSSVCKVDFLDKQNPSVIVKLRQRSRLKTEFLMLKFLHSANLDKVPVPKPIHHGTLLADGKEWEFLCMEH